MTNAEYVKSKLIEKIMKVPIEELFIYVLTIDQIKDDYALYFEIRKMFEDEVYPGSPYDAIETMMKNGKYFDEMSEWLRKEMNN